MLKIVMYNNYVKEKSVNLHNYYFRDFLNITRSYMHCIPDHILSYVGSPPFVRFYFCFHYTVLSAILEEYVTELVDRLIYLMC